MHKESYPEDHLMECTLEIIRKNLIDIGLKLSTQNTKLVVLNKRQKYLEGTASLKINQHTIMNSEKFLGINLNSAFNFRGHINEIHAKCSKLINIIKFLKGVWWGSHLNTLITILFIYCNPCLSGLGWLLVYISILRTTYIKHTS